MIKLDFSNVTGGNFEPLPAGDYKLEIEKVEEKTSKAGNPMLNVTFNVVDHEEYEGRKVFDLYVLTEKALWKLKDLFIAIGKDVDGIIEFDPQDLVGEMFIGNITVEESDGYDPQNRIKKHKKLADDEIVL